MTRLNFELTRTDDGDNLFVGCGGCGGRSCVAGVGMAIEDADFAGGPPYAFLAMGRVAGLTDDEAAAVALSALDEALEAGPVEEPAPGGAAVVDGVTLWRSCFVRMRTDTTGPGRRAAIRARLIEALPEARQVRPLCAAEGTT